MFHSICGILQKKCSFWINPLNTQRINNKAIQLNVAQQIGFLIPKTLISNDPIEIRSFFHSNNGNIIHKSFSPMGWNYKGSIYTNTTNQILLEDLQDDRVLSACPGIYQHYIDKNFEVRVTIIGEQIFSVKLDSQAHGQVIDYRLPLFTDPFPVKPILLPDEIQEKLSCFMKKNNLLFGCFDFIVSKENDWIFLEVNPMGQFLWMEELCPELPLLDNFCKFLLSENEKENFLSKSIPILHLADFIEHHEKEGNKWLQHHLMHEKPISIAE